MHDPRILFIYVSEQFISNVCCRGRQMKITSSCKMYTIFENALASRTWADYPHDSSALTDEGSVYFVEYYMPSARGLIMNGDVVARTRTTIIAFYNGNRSRSVRVMANIGSDLMKRPMLDQRLARSRANEYFLDPFSRFVVEFSADGLNQFFLSFFYQNFHSKVQFSTFILCTLFPFLCHRISLEF